MDACPAERINRSLSGHLGSLGLCLRNRSQRVYAMGAAPMGAPGCPDFAFSTASTDKKRMVLMQSSSSSMLFIVKTSIPPLACSKITFYSRYLIEIICICQLDNAEALTLVDGYHYMLYSMLKCSVWLASNPVQTSMFRSHYNKRGQELVTFLPPFVKECR